MAVAVDARASVGDELTEERIFQEALGICTGDVVTTSYGTGPYEVWRISGPRLWRDGLWRAIYPATVISLALLSTGHTGPVRSSDFCFINDVLREGERWFTLSGNEVFVRPPTKRPLLQVDMFSSYPPDPQPYPYQAGVDYSAGDRRLWHCSYCGRDCNAEPPGPYAPPPCPYCGMPASTNVIVLRRGTSGLVQALRQGSGPGRGGCS